MKTTVYLIVGAMALLAGCASAPVKEDVGKLTCESFLIYDLCIRDLTGDGLVDYMYFDDTKEIFLYREGNKMQVAKEMALHRCAMPMTESTLRQSTKLLYEENLSLMSEMVLKGKLVGNYLQAKAKIDDCYADDTASPEPGEADDFFVGEPDW